MDFMVKDGSMMTSALTRAGRWSAWTRPVMWKDGRTARICLRSDGVICMTCRQCDITFW